MKRFLYIALCFISLWASAAYAQSSAWQGIDKTQVRLISAMTALGEKREILLGLQFKMQDDWKVYWRSPGDAGYPPEIDWSASTNLENAQMQWPVPHRFQVLGLETVGYKKEVVYPLVLTVKDNMAPLVLNAHVRFLTCAEVCVPVETDLSMNLPSGSAQASEFAQLINQYSAQVPRPARAMNATLKSATFYPNNDKRNGIVRYEITTDWVMKNPDALGEGPLELAFFKPTLALSDDGKSVVIDAPFNGLQFLEGNVEDKDFTLTLMDGMHAIEATTKVKLATEPLSAIKGYQSVGQTEQSSLSLGFILALAVLGGLILNLMPCVLPVLSLKVLGLVSHGGGNPKTVRWSFLASGAGILFSFLVLAGVLIAMKAGGASIGWGIQFQQPLFLIALCLVVILFACNMWGFFEINLPSWLSDVGERSGHIKGLGGHFMTGAFATLLATPCSAPFLGTAVGFALSQGPVEIALVFAALGFGMSLPYLLIALFPKLATHLPKPGRWMVVLRKIMGLALVGTAVWLLSVLMAQVGLNAALTLSALMAGIIVILALRTTLRKATPVLVAMLFVAAFAVPSFATHDQGEEVEIENLWTKFDQSKIQGLVAQGQVVFVDVTADWCITCQVNKKLVLHRGDSLEALSGDDVTAMKADWTNPDDVIATYLASYKRFAIPFNIVYGPGAPEGIILPELLNKEDVLDAILKAKG
ncbi:MAG: thioredoxin family protein [Methylocystaceae bacterium]|nr:thioredoxin family protein [Methylocystaceae bacterium]